MENFLRVRKRICYGGTAINALLPPQDQFYDMNVELPDYDFFSPDPLKDAKDLADIYYKKGFTKIEAKASSLHKTPKPSRGEVPFGLSHKRHSIICTRETLQIL